MAIEVTAKYADELDGLLNMPHHLPTYQSEFTTDHSVYIKLGEMLHLIKNVLCELSP
jgi:hypothetical protein